MIEKKNKKYFMGGIIGAGRVIFFSLMGLRIPYRATHNGRPPKLNSVLYDHR